MGTGSGLSAGRAVGSGAILTGVSLGSGFGVIPGLAQGLVVGSKVGLTLSLGVEVGIGLTLSLGVGVKIGFTQGLGVEVSAGAVFTEKSTVPDPPSSHLLVLLTGLPSTLKEMIFPENLIPDGCITERAKRPRTTFAEATSLPSMNAVTMALSGRSPSIVTVPANLWMASV